MKTPKRSRYTEPMALRVAAGMSIKDAGAEVGCGESQCYAISRSDEFKQRVSEIRADALQRSVGILTDAATKAAAKLVELMQDEDPKIQLAAASKLLTTIVPLTELHDLRREIAELREQLKPRIAATA